MTRPRGRSQMWDFPARKWDTVCVHPANVLLTLLWWSQSNEALHRHKGLQTFWAERSLLNALGCSLLRRPGWPPSSYLPPPSHGLCLILKGLVMNVFWLRPLRIIDFPFGEETMHWTETERKKIPIFSRMKQLILADWSIWSDPKQMLSFHCLGALKKPRGKERQSDGEARCPSQSYWK